MEVSSDLTDLLRAFNDAGVRYLIVGAHALAFHHSPRNTKDLDVWIEASKPNAEAAYRALAKFGAPLDKLTPDDLATADVVFQIGVEPFRIDIMTSISGVSFSDAWASKATSTYGDVPVTIIGRDHLLANKKAAGRLQDLADVEKLERS